MNTLTIIRGVPGAGKSTLASMLENENTKVVSADHYFINDKGEYNWKASEIGAAHSACQFNAYALLDAGFNVVVDNTSSTNREILVYTKIAEALGAKVVSVIVENRHGNDSIHEVPQVVRERMEANIMQSIKLI